MRYMMLIAGSEDAVELDDDEGRRDEGQMGEGGLRAWWDGHVRAGRIVAGERLAPSAAATTVRIGPTGVATISDSPLRAPTEDVSGYAILDVEDLDAAIRLASSWPRHGSALEIRPVMLD